MKRQPLTLAIALLLVVGAALWGVNYRLDHPPLTQADKEFRALVAGAEGVEIYAYDYKKTQTGAVFGDSIKLKTLDAAQTRELIEQLRFVQVSPAIAGRRIQVVYGIELHFSNRDRFFYAFDLRQTPHSIELSDNMMRLNTARLFKLNPRFNKRLNRALDAYLPQRVRP